MKTTWTVLASTLSVAAAAAALADSAAGAATASAATLSAWALLRFLEGKSDSRLAVGWPARERTDRRPPGWP
jgi:hypothetical protein